MRKKIPDFTDSQTWTIESTLKERFRENIQVQSIENEIRLPPHGRELTPVTGLYREAESKPLHDFKTGQSKYRRQFFYRIHQQYGTGIEEYDEIKDCIISLPRTQPDHARNTQQVSKSSH